MRQATDKLITGIGRDDDEAELDESALAAEEDAATEAATAAGAIGAGTAWQQAIERELQAARDMRQLADAHRAAPDAKVHRLLAWIDQTMCPGLGNGAGRWSDRRVIIFTEYEDTRRWLERLLRDAIADTEEAAHRIATFTGATPADRREQIKEAFNAPPHKLRILIATDAAREGLNLQRHCRDLFHFDLPWNPSRLEQRNGRIDRKLQPAPQVFCRYFIYLQRPEDRVLKRLIEKTETIRCQLGSAAPVLEARIAELFAGGIGRRDIDRLETDIDRLQQDDRQRRAREDLEPVREADKRLVRSLEQLRSRLEASQKRVGVDRTQLRRAITYGLALAEAPLLRALDGEQNSGRFAFAEEEIARTPDPELRATLDTLRKPALGNGERPLRPIAFEPPADIDAETVQLHLEHPLVQRLLGRFVNQGLVHHDLSRTCLAISPDAQPRVVLMGRLSLWGEGATRLHEEIVRVAARWIEPQIRKTTLKAAARDAERETMTALDRALDEPQRVKVPDGVVHRLLRSVARDIAELLPVLEARGQQAETEAAEKLALRAVQEAKAMRELIEAQRRRIERELSREDDPQLALDLMDVNERRQRALDRRAWQERLSKIRHELDEQPRRIAASYVVKARRLEPVGLVYLWPATG